MAKYRLGSLIDLAEEKNKDNKLDLTNLKGISIKKEFIETKADMDGVSLSNYLLIKPDYFGYVTVTSRNGEKITLAHNDTNNTYICSSSYVVFYISKPDTLNSDYLFMYFNRPEFDRYSRFNSWGSARETFSWNDMCDIEIDLPSLSEQKKFVAVYRAMVENQRAYERGLDDLKLTCDGYIEKLRTEMPCEFIGQYLQPIIQNNFDYTVKHIMGVNANSEFQETKVKMDGIDIAKYTVVSTKDFAYNPSRINLGSIALFKGDKCAVSPMYEVFNINNKEKLLPEYLMLWLSRKEFHRSTLFYAIGSVRDTFNLELMKEVRIPIPRIEIQQAIVDIYNAYITRKEINKQLKTQIKDMCRILIKGSLRGYA
ncbi:MAG: restriction endonuclease subunit S [Christensenellaceae bacterium]|jgi:type I restriction enzyme S subunit|nr:restriction endonuclease subunit S [Christensenellaceae bacterium]